MAPTKEDILGAKDTDACPVTIPEWGGQHYLRVLTGTELDALTTAQARLGGERSTQPAALAAEVLVRCLSDESGRRIFEDRDAGALAGKSAAVLARVAQEAMELNGLTQESAESIRGN